MKIFSCLILAPHISFLPLSAIFSVFLPLPIWEVGKIWGYHGEKCSTEQRSWSPENQQAGRGKDLLRTKSLFLASLTLQIKGAACWARRQHRKFALLSFVCRESISFTLKAWLLMATKIPLKPNNKPQQKSTEHPHPLSLFLLCLLYKSYLKNNKSSKWIHLKYKESSEVACAVVN